MSQMNQEIMELLQDHEKKLQEMEERISKLEFSNLLAKNCVQFLMKKHGHYPSPEAYSKRITTSAALPFSTYHSTGSKSTISSRNSSSSYSNNNFPSNVNVSNLLSSSHIQFQFDDLPSTRASQIHPSTGWQDVVLELDCFDDTRSALSSGRFSNPNSDEHYIEDRPSIDTASKEYISRSTFYQCDSRVSSLDSHDATTYPTTSLPLFSSNSFPPEIHSMASSSNSSSPNSHSLEDVFLLSSTNSLSTYVPSTDPPIHHCSSSEPESTYSSPKSPFVPQPSDLHQPNSLQSSSNAYSCNSFDKILPSNTLPSKKPLFSDLFSTNTSPDSQENDTEASRSSPFSHNPPDSPSSVLLSALPPTSSSTNMDSTQPIPRVTPDPLGESLLSAVKQGNFENTESLLDQGADITYTDKNKRTALHWAAFNTRTKIVEFLLNKGADVNARDLRARTPLHLAAADEDGSCVELLVNAGANVNSVDCLGDTPLHPAARLGNDKAIRFLLSSGADNNMVDVDGKTPYDVAVGYVLRAILRPRTSKIKQYFKEFPKLN